MAKFLFGPSTAETSFVRRTEETVEDDGEIIAGWRFDEIAPFKNN